MADQANEGLLSPFLRRKRFAAAKPYLHDRVLDYGCGSGGLANFTDSASYCGVEIDNESLKIARECYPKHRFLSSLPDGCEKFDTVVSLAVIEHVKDPVEFLKSLAIHLNDRNSKLLVTTPHPAFDWLHDLGAKFGFFSRHANEEHEELLNKTKLELVGKSAGLKLIQYKRFLFGTNQIAIFTKLEN